ncbi:glycosyltransferase [Lactiplantibacillus daoliensis]|uniref:Glycosyltransferase n=1 Tax=Lactiplantibacillus daoliensis TaxID=2559916 RepID=A0ABW1UE41_9LACO|nr:glycosyltransferase [Lactiplantibacillus daoliensis]
MLDILVTYPKLSGNGGIETVLTSLLNSYEKNNRSIQLFLPGGSEQVDWIQSVHDSEKKIKLKNSKTLFGQLIATFIYVLYMNPKVVIVLSKGQIMACFLAKIFNRKLKIVSWNHFSLDVTRSKKLLRVFKLCDAHLSISSGISKQLAKLGIEEEKIYTIYNPIKKVTNSIPRSVGNVHQVYYIGRVQFTGQKNLSELFKVLAGLKNLKWHLTIIGGETDLDKEKLLNLATELQITANISWLGWVKSPWEHVKSADALVLTSNFEGLPMILCEGIAHGIPVMSSDCETGPVDIVDNNVNGYLYHLHDVQDGTQKLARLLRSRKKFSDTGSICKTAEKFSESEYFTRFDSLITSLIGD